MANSYDSDDIFSIPEAQQLSKLLEGRCIICGNIPEEQERSLRSFSIRALVKGLNKKKEEGDHSYVDQIRRLSSMNITYYSNYEYYEMYNRTWRRLCRQLNGSFQKLMTDVSDSNKVKFEFISPGQSMCLRCPPRCASSMFSICEMDKDTPHYDCTLKMFVVQDSRSYTCPWGRVADCSEADLRDAPGPPFSEELSLKAAEYGIGQPGESIEDYRVDDFSSTDQEE